MISMENGLMTLNIASLNPDSTRETPMQKEIVKGLDTNKIHIASIQETHITQDKSYVVENYRIITASADKSEATGIVTGWAAIMIRESQKQRIKQIARQIIRALRVTLDHAKSRNANSCKLNIRTAKRTHGGKKDDGAGGCKSAAQQDM